MPAMAPGFLEIIDRLPAGSRLLLEDVSWDEYENLLEELGENRRVRISYDQGRMEIMTLGWKHESYKTFFPHLVQILTEEMNLPLRGGGSITLKRRPKARGK